MSEFRVFESVQFQEDLDGITAGRREKLVAKLNGFVYPQHKSQPYFGKNIRKLRDFKPETWRYRIGSYRFFYIIDEKEKTVFMVSADFYPIL